MPRDIINADALHDHTTTLRACLRRAAEGHRSVRKAHRRKADPDWAQRKFEGGAPLHRFDEGRRGELVGLIRDQLDGLGRVAGMAAQGGPFAREAAAVLRGLPHHRGDLRSLGHQAAGLIERAGVAGLRARRHEALRPPAAVAAGPLVGTRCVSIEEVMRLGRRARNCLATRDESWRRLAEGERDYWSLREGDRLVAVLEVGRPGGEVVEALGPANATVGLRDARDVARFCEAAGLRIGAGCAGLLPGFAAEPVVAPTVVEVGGRVALYAEWPAAVRVDLGGEAGTWWGGQGPARVLALAFDPGRPLAEAILGGDDPRGAVAGFGRRRLRRIVGSVARGHATPTLVQHRLLALSA